MSRPRDAAVATWDAWTSSRLAVLDERRLLRSLRPVVPFDAHLASSSDSPVRVRVSDATFRAWLAGAHDLGDSIRPHAEDRDGTFVPASPPSSSTRLSTPPGSPSRPRTLRLFSSNDYLGLSAHPAVRAAAASAAARHGSGPRSSALVCGYTRDHRELETRLASLKRAEEALLFPTGFAANLGVIPALADGPDVHVFSDALNHASIVDGCRLAKAKGARVSVYRHADAAHLETLVRSSDARRKLVVTDTLFSMDGDAAPLGALARVRARYPEVCLMVDEAHATLVMGATGGGAVEAAGIEDDVDVHVGTLSKAFGSHGGFVACARRVKSLLASAARAHAFSTALPAPAVAAASAALLTCQNEGHTLRKRLWSHVRALDVALGGSGEGFDPDAPKALLARDDENARASDFYSARTRTRRGRCARTIDPRAFGTSCRVRSRRWSSGRNRRRWRRPRGYFARGFTSRRSTADGAPRGRVDFASRSPPRTTRKTSPRCAPRWDAPTRKCDTFPGEATWCGREGS